MKLAISLRDYASAGVIAAAALKCMGGSLQGRLYPRSEEERQKAVEAGYDVEKLLFQDDLCKGEQVGQYSCASSLHCGGSCSLESEHRSRCLRKPDVMQCSSTLAQPSQLLGLADMQRRTWQCLRDSCIIPAHASAWS